jgi:DNA-binding beta-propeller fold protein YncE
MFLMGRRRVTLLRKIEASVALFALALFIFADAVAGLDEREHGEQAAPLYWPEPPARARIKFLGSVSSPKDLRLKRSSFFKRVLRKIVGSDEDEPSLVFPYGVATDSRGRMIVADSKLRAVHIFDVREKKYAVLKQPKDDMLVSPVGLAVDADDQIYVSDPATGKVFVYDREGNFKTRLGPDEGMFDRPTGIAIDKARRRLYVVETRRGLVAALTLEGSELFKFGKRGQGAGEFNRPTQIFVRGDKLYVTDTLNARVQVFDPDGNFIKSIGHLGDSAGYLDKPKGVAVDSEGHIYVVEGLRDAIDVFDEQGNFLLEFGRTGSGRGEFFLPTAIHIDDSDQIFVSDTYNRRVEVFKYLGDDSAASR